MEFESCEPLKKIDTIISIPAGTLPIETKKEWISCCFKMSPSAVKYFTQVIILYLLILYSCCMLIIYPDCQSQKNFSALLMIAIGTLIPNPKFG
jgi:hypothetical protein